MKERLDAEQEERELSKRKKELEKEREELERDREEKLREQKQEERLEKERITLSYFFGENDEASAKNISDVGADDNEDLKAFILKKQNWMNDQHFQRVMTYFIEDIFVLHNPHLLEVARYLSSYICHIFKKNKDDYNPVKHMRILLKTFFKHDDNQKECLSVLQMMSAEIKRLQRVFRVNYDTRFESVTERLGISHATDVNATFGDYGISHMTLAYISDNKQMVGYLYNHGGKITTVMEFFEINCLKNNPKLNSPVIRLMILMYVAIEIYEIGIKWISPINDEELVAEFDDVKACKKKKKNVEKTAVVTETVVVSTETATKEEDDDDDDENDLSVFAKKSVLVVAKQTKKLQRPILKAVENYEKPYVKPYEKPYVKPYVKPYEKPYVKPYVKPYEKPYVKPYEKPYVKPYVKPYEKIEKPYEKPVVRPILKRIERPETKQQLSPRAVKLASLLQQPPLPRPAFLGLQYVSFERILYAIDCVCHLKHY